ncbi:hypothetical protein BIFCAT_01055 [Bifidobacterium catenulatum DSM 16992 = JCM 1194 = LMG 11043]|uniref:Uncharacterized protein n=1 Tax=Bifidobacterium catenulatum DSM 16992 = JCM 1194 = LMG 11043 TaxID=566552 RepID=B6XU06_9BIFI|nr:hypothetical protein BIFCAT_01055 [Bifidobacterium catenulatum DSM 16992 = JCM 1194 = LMG 11043]
MQFLFVKFSAVSITLIQEKCGTRNDQDDGGLKQNQRKSGNISIIP